MARVFNPCARFHGAEGVGLLTVALLLTLAGCARHAAALGAAAPQPQAPRRVLHVAADPNNLPFTNERLEGFENKIARVIADELGADVQYAWRAQRRGFFRHAFNDDGCEVVMGVPVGFDLAATTRPYYRSTYVFVSRADRKLKLTSFDDPRLAEMKIGIHVLGDADEGSATPAGLALARRGLANNLVGYTVYGDYRVANPTARLVEAVAAGEVDVAVVWGPVAGYFASRCGVPLDLAPVTPAVEPPGLKFAFGISIGVKKGEAALKEELQAALERRRGEIERILDDYGVPRAPATELPTDAAARTADIR